MVEESGHAFGFDGNGIGAGVPGDAGQGPLGWPSGITPGMCDMRMLTGGG